jgi:hypothetical protein
MFVITRKDDPIELTAMPVERTLTFSGSQESVREMLDPRGLPGIEQVVQQNLVMKQIIEEVDSGKPGHYHGRDIMLEGAMPAAHFFLAPLEYGGDTDWWRDDAKFQDMMKRNSIYNWLVR